MQVQDFFDCTEKVDAIICNQPYRHAQRFVEHGLTLAPKVVMLLRLVFVEGQRRKRFYATTPPARIWVTARRASIPGGVYSGECDRHGAILQPKAKAAASCLLGSSGNAAIAAR